MEETERTKPDRFNFTVLEKDSQYTPTIAIEQQLPSGKMAMDVYSQQIEPICDYRTCNHKFSTHRQGSKCKRRHHFNYAAGVSLYSK